MLNSDDSLEHGPMVDVWEMWELGRFRRQHRGVKQHVVILDPGHVQGCVVRSGLDSDIALSPADHPEILLGNPAANFGVPNRKMLRHFAIALRSLMRLTTSTERIPTKRQWLLACTVPN